MLSLRNLAAHQIISVTGITIQSQTGYTGKQIMEMLKKHLHLQKWESRKSIGTLMMI